MNTKLSRLVSLTDLSAAAGEGSAGGVAASNVAPTGTDTKPEATKKEPANIVRGVMPVALVAHIKFNTAADAKAADVAKIYGTTSGKVADIMKGRNFGYLTKDFLPSKEQKDAAVAWMKKVPGYGEAQDKIIVDLEKTPDATKEQTDAFLAARAAGRSKTPKAAPAAGEVAAASEASAGNGKADAKAGKKGEAKADPAAAKDLLK